MRIERLVNMYLHCERDKESVIRDTQYVIRSCLPYYVLRITYYFYRFHLFSVPIISAIFLFSDFHLPSIV